jgi:hypothetical protein
MKRSHGFNATVLQYCFIALMVLMIAGIVGIVVLAQQFMSQQALSTDHYRTDAELAQEELVRLQQLKTTLAQDKDAIEKTAKIVSASQEYQFQDQIVRDLTLYATKYGVDIISFDFGTKPGSAPQGTAAATGSSAQTKTIVSIQLGNNIPYTSFLQFLKAIENNITKMQLTGISLQPNATNPNQILGPTIEMEVFLR